MTVPTHGAYPAVTRIEVIDPAGRSFVAYYQDPGLDWQLQDLDPTSGAARTLKLFPHALPINDWIDARPMAD